MHVRNSARAVLVNEHGQFLLFRFYFKHRTDPLWVTPGGGLEPDEDFETAVMRELFEETGMKFASAGRWVWTRDVLIKGDEGDFISHERYFLITVEGSTISLDHFTDNERNTFVGYRWWTPEEVAQSGEEFRPKEIGELVKALLAGEIPQEPVRIE